MIVTKIADIYAENSIKKHAAISLIPAMRNYFKTKK